MRGRAKEQHVKQCFVVCTTDEVDKGHSKEFTGAALNNKKYMITLHTLQRA